MFCNKDFSATLEMTTARSAIKTSRRLDPSTQFSYFRQAIFKETLIKSLSDFILGFFIQSEETFDANSELFKENVDDTMYKNPYEI